MINKEEVRNILIVRTDRLGDVILTLPLVNLVKKIFKDSKLYFLGKKYVEELIHDYEGIDEFIAEENTGTFTEKIKYFKSKKIDLVINVKPEFDLALMFYLAEIKYRIGTGYRWYSFLYNQKVFEHRKISDKHESEYNVNLIRIFFPEEAFEKKFYFKYAEEDKNKLKEKLRELNLNTENNYIIIHPGSGGSARDLSPEKISVTANLLLEKYPEQKIVFTGLKGEGELISKIMKNIESENLNRVTDLSGKLDLRELLIITDNSDLFISHSTGPIHIAGALNKNIIGIYPDEEAMSSSRWGSLSENTIIINPTPGSNDMESIQPKVILTAAGKFL